MANPTQYYRPRTLDEAAALAAEPGALAMAGGALTFGQSGFSCAALVDLQDVAELKTVETTAAGLQIGAACTLASLLERDDIPAALKTALTRTISPNVLNNASVGEAILRRNDDTLIEWLTTLVAAGAGVEVIIPQRTASRREWRLLAVADEHLNTELITTLILPIGVNTRLGLAQVARTPAAPAIVCAAARVDFDSEGRITQALGATGDMADAWKDEMSEARAVNTIVLGSLTGWPLNHETIMAVLEENFGSWRHSESTDLNDSYREAMTPICVQRALEACIRQQEGQEANA